MPIEVVARLTPELCRQNPAKLYVFGDNMQRKGRAGQAVIRGEPNAVGLATKWRPAVDDNAYFKDWDLRDLLRDGQTGASIERLYAHLRHGGIVVWPDDGIGTGMARLHETAPAIAEFYGALYRSLGSIG